MQIEASSAARLALASFKVAATLGKLAAKIVSVDDETSVAAIAALAATASAANCCRIGVWELFGSGLDSNFP